MINARLLQKEKDMGYKVKRERSKFLENKRLKIKEEKPGIYKLSIVK